MLGTITIVRSMLMALVVAVAFLATIIPASASSSLSQKVENSTSAHREND
ncbi:hypothetical protein ACFLZK_02580 [Patescibacteria group bacterium]